MKKLILALLIGCLVVLAGCGGTTHQAPKSTAQTTAIEPVPTCASQVPQVRPCGPHVRGWALQPPQNVAPPRAIVTPTREMFDTITVGTVPANPWAVAGYTSGFWPTFLPLVRAFPGAHHLSIAINAWHDADCADDEPLDLTNTQTVGWIKRQLITLHHKLVCAYTSISNMGALKSLVAAAGVALQRVKWWCAWYRFRPGLVSGCDAVQWTDTALGRNLDESTVRTDFFGPPPPPPGPTPATLQLWEKIKNGAFRVYHNDGCKHPQDKNPYCSREAALVKLYQGKLWANGTPKRWACFGPKSTARLRKSEVCWIVRPEVAYYSGARDASQKAFDRHVCGGANGQTGLTPKCKQWRQRVRYFGTKATALVKAYS